jgi:hypothetical protein
LSVINPIAIIAILYVAMYWYMSETKKNQILCRCRRRNRTLIAKFVKMQNRYVVFDDFKFDIIPSRVVWQWYPIMYIFHLWLPTLDYSWNSRFPHNPDNLDDNSETPEVRKALNKTEWMESYYKGSKPSSQKGKSLGFIQQWLPLIAILLVVVVAVYFNSKMSGFGKTLDAVINQMNSMAK